MKVLIAEDDPTSRRVLEASLVERGYDVVIAQTAVRRERYLRS